MNERKSSIHPGAADTGSLAAGIATGKPVRRIRSEDLFDDAEEVLIEHNGRIYTLTRGMAGGLVLRA